MPALFIGHGSPMNTLDDNAFTRSWRALGRMLPRPRAILCVSAHWYFGATAITAMPRPRTIHDFYGFPEPLFEFDYPAPGDPDLAGEIVEMVKPDWVGLDRDQWGLDHGTWSVLAHLYPEADVPVLQLSLNALRPLQYHLDLARKLATLRRMGVLVLGSGNVVHNLRMLDWQRPDMGYDWARRFDEAAMRQLAEDPAAVLTLADHPDHAKAVPTPDHFIPLLYLAGMAAEEGLPVDPLLQGYSMGGISMTSYGIGVEPSSLEATPEEVGGAARVPQAVPAVETNT
ncbi:4,5-DOPA dioxygenase extradiol [Erythrobacteraceae bacterium CFH 75059]|uniref:4,5-DOPA-extradiol-dioxygenase n=1 Tax=Qipengyuania thermophila TaxID=2509361 RepID=UPI0010219096|nr:4,5-DOPA dioxygenase extradiol [Qipengyuania thermophila]TCD02106.1 4,5-DOPA dioxygenase extradiol [Erythrobacteraceae bacterium CFH 75059]